MDLQLKNQTAFISGSTQGIGYAIARQLLAEGAHVIINGRNEAKTASAVERLAQEAGETGDFRRVDKTL